MYDGYYTCLSFLVNYFIKKCFFSKGEFCDITQCFDALVVTKCLSLFISTWEKLKTWKAIRDQFLRQSVLHLDVKGSAALHPQLMNKLMRTEDHWTFKLMGLF